MHASRTLVVMLVLTFAATFGAAQERHGNFSEDVSGTFVDTAIDTNGDGVAAAIFLGQTKGHKGGASYQGLQELQFAPTGLCDAGEVEGVIVAYSIVRRFSNGDLLNSRLVDGNLCLDPASGTAHVEINAEIIGGTGRWEGATGTYTIEYDVVALLPDPTGGIAHGAFSGEASGSID